MKLKIGQCSKSATKTWQYTFWAKLFINTILASQIPTIANCKTQVDKVLYVVNY